jgi:hypothetical protein
MKFTLIIAAAFAAAANAGLILTPIFDNQVVDKKAGDCFFGVTTPQGCGSPKASW